MLRHVAEPGAQRIVGQQRGLAEQPHLAGLRFAQAQQRLQQRGLAGPVAAQQADDLTRRERPVQPRDHPGLPLEVDPQAGRAHRWRAERVIRQGLRRCTVPHRQRMGHRRFHRL